jgi:hypothetical protein
MRHWSLMRMECWPLRSPFQDFQAVSRWHAKLGEFRHGMELGELAQGRALNVWREGANPLQPEEAGGVLAGKGTDHA